MTNRRHRDTLAALLAHHGQPVEVRWPRLAEDENGDPEGVAVETFTAALCVPEHFGTLHTIEGDTYL